MAIINQAHGNLSLPNSILCFKKHATSEALYQQHYIVQLPWQFVFFCLTTELPKDTVELRAVKVVRLDRLVHSLLQKQPNNCRACETVTADTQHFLCLAQYGPARNTVRVIKSQS
jgi:hypothetical protein